MELAGASATPEQVLMAAIADNTRTLAWMQTEDGMKGINRPLSLLAMITGNGKETEDVAVSFASGEEFDAEWIRLTEGG